MKKDRAGEQQYDDYYRDDYYDDQQYNDRQGSGYGYGGGGGDSGGGLNPLALIVAPLAGIALLSAATAVALNPVLINVSVTGRKKRDAGVDPNDVLGHSPYLSPELQKKMEEMKVNFVVKCMINSRH